MRTNPFKPIYNQCNGGTNPGKRKQFQDTEMPCPKYLDIELTNCCNLKCYMCPVGTSSITRPAGFMSLDTVHKICEELKSAPIQGVRLIRWGEPTLHKDFLAIVKMFKETRKAVHFNTNGILLKRSDIEALLELELDSVKFSFQGVDEHSYEEMRNGSSFHTLLDNIDLFNELRGSRPKPFIQISTTTTDESEEQIHAFTDLIAGKCDYYNVGRTELQYLDVDKMKISPERKAKFLELQKQENLPKKHLHVCPEVFDKLSVNWDGSVSACCSDYDNLMLVGDLKNNTLVEIFNSEKLHKIREVIGKNDYDSLPLCRDCYEYI